LAAPCAKGWLARPWPPGFCRQNPSHRPITFPRCPPSAIPIAKCGPLFPDCTDSVAIGAAGEPSREITPSPHKSQKSVAFFASMDVRVSVVRVCNYGSDDLWGTTRYTSNGARPLNDRLITRPPIYVYLPLLDKPDASIDRCRNPTNICQPQPIHCVPRCGKHHHVKPMHQKSAAFAEEAK